MCDLEREIGLWLSGRILGVHPFANPNNALALGREQIGVNGERSKTRAAINGTAMNPHFSVHCGFPSNASSIFRGKLGLRLNLWHLIAAVVSLHPYRLRPESIRLT